MDDNTDLKKFKNLVNEIKIGILTTHSSDGKLKGRPMSTAQVDDIGNIWFFTNEFSNAVHEISKDNDVIISYSSPDKNSYIIVNGKAALSNDEIKMKALWNPMMKAWFPLGLEDPKLALLEVAPSEAEYWDGTSSKIIILAKMFKAILTGKEYNDNDTHGKLEL